MSWYRRASAPGLGKTSNRRRSSASYTIATGRRTSLASTSRIRSSSKGHVRDFCDDDIELYLPPLEEMPLVMGYEDVTFESCAVPPPPPTVAITEDEDTADEIGDLKPFTELPCLSEKEIRKALIRYADSKCALDKNAAREMSFTSIDYRPGYKYTLESFTETRQMSWSFEPYTGGPLDEVSACRPPPGPWDMECALPKPFQMHSLILDVPHTDALITCQACSGVGSKRCTACSAVGWEQCSLCLGDGYKISMQGHRERCFRCVGTGRKKCWKCGGETIAVCTGCNGTGQIRCFIAITITWTNHVDTDILDPSDALAISEKLEFVKGHLIFQDEKPMIPSVSFPVKDLQLIATALLEKHQRISSCEKLLLQVRFKRSSPNRMMTSSCASVTYVSKRMSWRSGLCFSRNEERRLHVLQRILRIGMVVQPQQRYERHGVWAIPVSCVTYDWKQKQKQFFLYGSKNEVHAPDFPESYCCCIVS